MDDLPLSVVVCTFNRASLLEGCLDSLSAQSSGMNKFEIVVVDNNSFDETEPLVQSFIARHPNIRYIKELNQGLSHARNRGYREARGELVAYLDDDGRAESNWTEEILSFIKRKPEAMAFGGPFDLFYLSPPPPWYKESYGSWSLGEEERPLRAKELLKGTNMVFNRSLLIEMGGFSTSVGMKGNIISYGEETHFMIRIKKRGIPLYYVPNIRVKHLVADYKMNMLWRAKAAFMGGYSMYDTFGFSRRPIRQLLYSLSLFLKGFIKLAFCREEYFKVRLFDSFWEFIWNLGLALRMFKK